MSIIFRDFWEDSPSSYHKPFNGDVAKSLLTNIMKSIHKADGAPITLTSVYKKKKITSRFSRLVSKVDKSIARYGYDNSSSPAIGCFNVWFTAENYRPPLFKGFDSYLSFDIDDYGERNFYFPLWASSLGPTLEHALEMQSYLLKPRDINGKDRRGFAVVVSNPEPIRTYFVERLREKSQVDIYGALGIPTQDKRETLERYNFNICFENDLYPGYVTEKLLEAYLAGCIPIWRGNDVLNYFNKGAYIDVSNLSIEESIKLICDIANDKERADLIRNEPLLTRGFPFDSVVNSLKTKYRDFQKSL